MLALFIYTMLSVRIAIFKQVPLILLHQMDLLLKKSTPSEVKEHLLPMIIGALNSSDHDVQVCKQTICFTDIIRA